MLVKFFTVMWTIAIALIAVVVFMVALAGCKAYEPREPCVPAGCTVPTPR